MPPLRRKNSSSKKKRSLQPQGQVRRFRDTARALGCDESEEAFDKALGKIGRASVPRKPVKRTKKPLKLAI